LHRRVEARVDLALSRRHHSRGGIIRRRAISPYRNFDMAVRFRTALPFSLALGVASMTLAAPARAQDAVVATPAAPAPVPAAPQPAASPAAGPRVDAAAVGVRHAPATKDAAAPRRGGYGQPVALMVVGGAAVLVGLIIGGGAGAAIAIGGAVAGLIGLYQYLQ
jgi:hypothetical protein